MNTEEVPQPDPSPESTLKGKNLVVVEADKNHKRGQKSRPRAQGGAVVPDMDAEADRIFLEGFCAIEGRWSNKTQSFHEFPDTRTRLATLTLYMAYRHGLPVQRIVRVEHAFRDRHAELVQIASTPSGKETLLRIGLITPEWLEKNIPSQSQQIGDSRECEKSQVPVVEQ